MEKLHGSHPLSLMIVATMSLARRAPNTVTADFSLQRNRTKPCPPQNPPSHTPEVRSHDTIHHLFQHPVSSVASQTLWETYNTGYGDNIPLSENAILGKREGTKDIWMTIMATKQSSFLCGAAELASAAC